MTEHGPVEQAYLDHMNALAAAIDDVLNGEIRPKKVGFVLLVFPFGEADDRSRINYISNGQREDIRVALKELLARWEGRYAEGGKQ